MLLRVERGENVDDKRNPELAHEVGHQIKKQLLVSAQLELIDYATLPPRSEKKSQRVFDDRLKGEIV